MDTLQSKLDSFWSERDRVWIRRHAALRKYDWRTSKGPVPVIFNSPEEAEGCWERLEQAIALVLPLMGALTPETPQAELQNIRNYWHLTQLLRAAYDAGAAYFVDRSIEGVLASLDFSKKPRGWMLIGETFNTPEFKVYDREKKRRWRQSPAGKRKQKAYDSSPKVRERRQQNAKKIALQEKIRYDRRCLARLEAEQADPGLIEGRKALIAAGEAQLAQMTPEFRLADLEAKQVRLDQVVSPKGGL